MMEKSDRKAKDVEVAEDKYVFPYRHPSAVILPSSASNGWCRFRKISILSLA